MLSSLVMFSLLAMPTPAVQVKPLNLLDGKSTFGWTVQGKAEVKTGTLMLGSDEVAARMTYPCVIPSDSMTIVTLKGSALIHVLDSQERTVQTFRTTRETLGTVSFSSDVINGSWTLSGHVGYGPFFTQEQVAVLKSFSTFGLKIETLDRTEIHSILVRPTLGEPLFNGKNLDGWKIFKGDAKKEASKWSVTDVGELKVENGPGDLQTTTDHEDFLVRLDVKTMGKALNSGLFFRCKPDEYQQGYEAQIQNAYFDRDRTKPTDFGTGAIYRRVPARRVVSNDNEWFTMHVLAVGPHLRTWVNGEPVVAWVDERPPGDNARTGLRLAAGRLSLQGHDPTTNILFKNLLLTDLSK